MVNLDDSRKRNLEHTKWFEINEKQIKCYNLQFFEFKKLTIGGNIVKIKTDEDSILISVAGKLLM